MDAPAGVTHTGTGGKEKRKSECRVPFSSRGGGGSLNVSVRPFSGLSLSRHDDSKYLFDAFQPPAFVALCSGEIPELVGGRAGARPRGK